MPGREGDGKDELIALVTTITDPRQRRPQRWRRPTTSGGSTRPGTTSSRPTCAGPGRILRSKSPDMVRQEIYGYLLTHHAITALICRAATEADIDPDRVKFLAPCASSAAGHRPGGLFPLNPRAGPAAIMADISRRRNLNPSRRHRSYPRVDQAQPGTTPTGSRAPATHGARHPGPATIMPCQPARLATAPSMINLR